MNSGIVRLFKAKTSIKLYFQLNAFPSLQYLLGTLSVTNKNSHVSVQALLLSTPMLVWHTCFSLRCPEATEVTFPGTVNQMYRRGVCHTKQEPL